jgi:hypothetical protein
MGVRAGRGHAWGPSAFGLQEEFCARQPRVNRNSWKLGLNGDEDRRTAAVCLLRAGACAARWRAGAVWCPRLGDSGRKQRRRLRPPVTAPSESRNRRGVCRARAFTGGLYCSVGWRGSQQGSSVGRVAAADPGAKRTQERRRTFSSSKGRIRSAPRQEERARNKAGAAHARQRRRRRLARRLRAVSRRLSREMAHRGARSRRVKCSPNGVAQVTGHRLASPAGVTGSRHRGPSGQLVPAVPLRRAVGQVLLPRRPPWRQPLLCRHKAANFQFPSNAGGSVVFLGGGRG